MEAQNTAAVMGSPTRFLREWMGGDFRNLMEMRDAGRATVSQFGGQKALAAGLIGQGISQGADFAGNVATLMGPGGILKGAGAGAAAQRVTTASEQIGAAGGLIGSGFGLANTIAAGSLGALDRGEMASIEGGIHAQRAMTPWRQASIDMMVAMGGARSHAARALQGKHINAWGAGMGHGLDFGESTGAAMGLMGRATLAEVFGSSSTRAATPGPSGGLTAAEISDLMGFDGKQRGMFRGLPMTGHGDGPGAAASNTIRSPGLLHGMLGLEARGFSREGAGGILSGFNSSMGGAITGGPERAMIAFEEAMGRGFAKGIKEVNFFEQMGKAVAEGSFGIGGRIGGHGDRAQLMFAGLGKDARVEDMAANIRGAQAMDATFRNNPYFNTIAAEAAKQVLGGSASGAAMRAVQQSGISELVGGSGLLDAVGLDKTQRMGIVNRMVTQMAATFAQGDLAAGIGKTGDAVSALDGMDVGAGQRGAVSEKRKKDLAVALTNNLGMDFMAANSVVNQIAEMNDLQTSGRHSPEKHGDWAASSVAAQQKVLMDLMKEEAEYRQSYLESLKNLDKAEKALKEASNAPNLESGKTFIVKVISEVEDPAKKPVPYGVGNAKPAGQTTSFDSSLMSQGRR